MNVSFIKKKKKKTQNGEILKSPHPSIHTPVFTIYSWKYGATHYTHLNTYCVIPRFIHLFSLYILGNMGLHMIHTCIRIVSPLYSYTCFHYIFLETWGYTLYTLAYVLFHPSIHTPIFTIYSCKHGVIHYTHLQTYCFTPLVIRLFSLYILGNMGLYIIHTCIRIVSPLYSYTYFHYIFLETWGYILYTFAYVLFHPSIHTPIFTKYSWKHGVIYYTHLHTYCFTPLFIHLFSLYILGNMGLYIIHTCIRIVSPLYSYTCFHYIFLETWGYTLYTLAYVLFHPSIHTPTFTLYSWKHGVIHYTHLHTYCFTPLFIHLFSLYILGNMGLHIIHTCIRIVSPFYS